jgi:hypothetical protein
MDCEELMVKQTEMTVAASPGTKVFVYRNMIKALPWFTSVREKITDPAYARWFMNFSADVIQDHSKAHVPVCDDNYKPPLCSNLYVTLLSTPYPSSLLTPLRCPLPPRSRFPALASLACEACPPHSLA